MKNAEVIRAWKNPEYRLSLSKAEGASMPEHPAGCIELTDEELGGASGAVLWSWFWCTLACSIRGYCTVGSLNAPCL